MSVCDWRSTKFYVTRTVGLATALAALASLTACGGGGGGGVPGGGTPGGGGSPVSNTQVIPASGGTVAVMPTSGSSFGVVFPAAAVPAGTSVTVSTVASTNLPAPINHVLTAHALTPNFKPDPNNVYVFAFQVAASGGVTTFNVPLTLTGNNLTTLPLSTVCNVAIFQNNTWVDVGTCTLSSVAGFNMQQPSTTLPGITKPGTYLIYQPASGTSTAVANYGIALIADDGNGIGQQASTLQLINLYDKNGNPLPTPVMSVLPVAGAGDLDGQALTPDGSQGALIDGGNLVHFFSGTQSGTPILNQNETCDITNYGGDGDSIAVMPNGDASVVSGDGTQLALITGILSGSATITDSIPVPGQRDGVVISNDGKVMLARGTDGLTTFAVNPGAAPLTAAAFTQTANLAALGTGGQFEDGRDGMAISPVDSSRAVVIGDAGMQPTVQLLSGLPGTPVVSNVRLNLPAAIHPYAPRRERLHPNITVNGVNRVNAVAVTPDGSRAIVGTDAGLVMVSGVNTGALTQVGSAFSPSFTVNGAQYNLNNVNTLGITLDGKYVVALTAQPSPSAGTLLVIPITSTGFGAPVGMLGGVAIPTNDQMLMH